MFPTQSACENRVKPSGLRDYSERYNNFCEFNDITEYIKHYWTQPKKTKQQRTTKSNPLVEDRVQHWRYKNTFNAVMNTLKYIMFRHRKGIYVSFRDGKLKHYTPFILSLNSWTKHNPYASYIELAEGAEGKIREYFEEEKKRREDLADDSVIQFQEKEKWYVIHCLICGVIRITSDYQKGVVCEPDFGFFAFLELFRRVQNTYRVPDCDFFLNTFDQVLLHKDLKSPFPHIFKGEIKHLRKKEFAPIVSNCTIRGFLDIPLPTQDDVARTTKMYAPPSCINTYVDDKYEHSWSKKISKAVFRGSATGCGWTPEDNKRIRLVFKEFKDVDAKLVSTDNIRLKLNPQGKIDYIPISSYGIYQSDDYFLTPIEQSQYKYIIHIEGNVAAFRISSLFAMKSVVIYVSTKYIMWIEPLLKHKENCYIVSSIDEIPEAVQWLKANDKEAKKIAENGYQLYKNYLQLNHIKRDTIDTLRLIHSHTV